jgi:glucokinase
MDVLAGDIGGTKTALLRGRWQDGRLDVLAEARYDSAAYADLAEPVREFLGGLPAPPQACFAVAGPVQPAPGGGTQARITNLPWQLDSARLAADLGIGSVTLINDLAGVGHGIAVLPPGDVVDIQPGTPRAYSPRAVLGVGTGLGMALLVPDRGGWRVFPSEGGHVDFAPLDDQQVRLREFARLRLGVSQVSFERLASGPGLALLHEFLGGPAVDAATVSSRAGAGDTRARQAMQLFARLCGAVAGNLALTCLPFGGLYLAGGVVQKNEPLFASQTFLTAFRAKGRMADLLADIPVRLIREPRVGLLGAAASAASDAA